MYVKVTMCPDDVWQTVTVIRTCVCTYIHYLFENLSECSIPFHSPSHPADAVTYVRAYTASSFLCSLQLFLEAPDDIQCFKFNPYKPNFVVGGCLNGLVSVYCVAMVLLYCYCVVSFDIILTVRTHVCRST